MAHLSESRWGFRRETPQVKGGGMRRHVADLLALTRPRVLLMVLATTLVGFYLGSQGDVEYPLLVRTLLGVALAAGGTAALNQYLERQVDSLMERTRGRPLPEGRLPPSQALAFGAGLVAGGLLFLTLTVNALSGLMTATVVGSYLFLYTPLKRRSPLSTLVGAFPGALPPVIGWAGARGEVSLGAGVLFAILFLWQVPHSLAIARLYREDYARAGIRFLPVIDPEGRPTECAVLTHCLALLTVGLLPTPIGLAGSTYFFGALVLGGAFLGSGIGLARSRSEAAARRLRLASLVYLPAVLGLLAFDKIPL